MAEQQTEHNEEIIGDDVDNPNYKPPAQKTISEIQSLDADDESLKKYKETLLGTAKEGPPKPNDPRNVIVDKLAFCSEGRPEIELDLSGDLNEVAKKTFVVKEGSQYKLKIFFFVQREIVSGLVYKQKITRKGLPVDTNRMMVGSYAPKKELHVYTTNLEDVPSGMLARGSYNIKNQFIDDDKNVILQWDFKMEIKKDWDE